MATGTYRIGFGEVDITPSKPLRLGGYYYERVSTGAHDRLFARSFAASDGTDRVVLCVADLIFVPAATVDAARKLIHQRCGLAPECVMFSAIHTHTGPDIRNEQEYVNGLPALLAESVAKALDNLAPRELVIAHGEAPGLQFIRRYRMKDGSVRTNPGIGNPDVDAPIGTVNPAVNVLLSRNGGAPVGLAHFGLHCDTVGGTEMSADWTHYLREGMREALGRDLTLLTPIAACGDVNHWNVFKDVSLRGFAETERIGRRIAQAALESLKSAQPVKSGPVSGARKEIDIPLRVATSEEIEAAKKLLETPAPVGVDFTLDRVIARRHLRVAEAGPFQRVEVNALAIGDVGIVGIPAEYFSELERDIIKRSPFAHTLVVTMANGIIGYVGTRKNYEEGGYEMTSSLAAPGAGELLANTAIEMLRKAKG